MIKKKSKTNDSVELWTKFLEYILERISKRYDNIDELSDDVNKKFRDGMEVIQSNYDRWFDSELKPNMAIYGIELLGDEGEDIVSDEMPDKVDEDEFLTDEEKEVPEEINEENFFNDEEEEPPQGKPQPEAREKEPLNKQ